MSNKGDEDVVGWRYLNLRLKHLHPGRRAQPCRVTEAENDTGGAQSAQVAQVVAVRLGGDHLQHGVWERYNASSHRDKSSKLLKYEGQ